MPTAQTTTSAASITALLDRMRGGDRDAAAEFMTRFGSRLRRRIRGKLRPAMRRLFDSQEILSTLGRRLDLYVRAGRLEAHDEPQLWKLLVRMTDNAIVDKATVFRRLEAAEGEDGELAHQMLGRLRAGTPRGGQVEIEIDRALRVFDDGVDRQILSMWLMGDRFTEIASIVEITPSAVRHRWRRIRSTLQERFEAELS